MATATARRGLLVIAHTSSRRIPAAEGEAEPSPLVRRAILCLGYAARCTHSAPSTQGTCTMPTTALRRRIAARPITAALVAFAAIVALCLLVMGGFAVLLASTYNSSRHTFAHAFPAATSRPPASTGKAGKAVNLLVLGTDADAADPESPEMVGKTESDTVMVVHVPADRKHVYAMSILRNSVVAVPGHGQQPINAAFAYGGSPLAVQTVEQLIGVRIDHVVVVSLAGTKGLTDALGGVTVSTKQEIVGKDGDTFVPGRHKLDGTQALSYLRAGNFKAVGDRQRAEAQESYFRAVFDQVLSAKTLLEPLTINTVVTLFSPYLTTDKGFDAAAIASLGFELRGVHASDIKLFRLPIKGIAELHGATVLDLDQGAVTRAAAAFKSDSLQTVAH